MAAHIDNNYQIYICVVTLKPGYVHITESILSCLDTADNSYSNLITSSANNSICKYTLCCPEQNENGNNLPPPHWVVFMEDSKYSHKSSERREDERNKIIVQTTHVITDNHPY